MGSLRILLRLYSPHRPAAMTSPNTPSPDPLHGITLEMMIQRLMDRHGWRTMGKRIPVKCFLNDPSVKSSLTFLRKTPWARKKVEDWYRSEEW